MGVSRGQPFGFVPSIKNPVGGEKILQGPSISTIYTFPQAGRVWLATVSYAIGSSGGVGTNQGYARINATGVQTLAICECVVVGAPDSDSNEESNQFFGLPVPAGTVIRLDVNNNVAIAGLVQRASGIFIGSIP